MPAGMARRSRYLPLFRASAQGKVVASLSILITSAEYVVASEALPHDRPGRALKLLSLQSRSFVLSSEALAARLAAESRSESRVTTRCAANLGSDLTSEPDLQVTKHS